MIWHIFRKDCRVLRLVIGGTAFAHAIAAATWISIGPFEQGSSMVQVAYLLSSLALICMVLLVVMAVQEDPLTGVARDWSVRPISRRDMLLAKIVFALIAAHGPLLIVDFLEALAFGFSVTQAAGAAAARGLAIFCSFTAPALVIAAFTRKITTWIGVALIWIIGTTLLFAVVSNGQSAWMGLATMDVLGWMPNLAATALMLCASAIALPLLYARKFVTAAGVVLAAPALTSLALMTSWDTLFEIQRSLFSRDELVSGVQVGFDVDHSGIAPSIVNEGFAVLWIPLQLSGLADDRTVVIDNAIIRLVDNGTTVFRQGDSRCLRVSTGGVTCTQRGNSTFPDHGTGTARATFQLNLPRDIYDRLRNRPLQMELDFALTLLDRTGNVVVSSQDEHRWLDVSDSRCLARRRENELAVQLRCLHTTPAPACQRTLINIGIKHSANMECRFSYAPFVAQRFPDVIDRSTPMSSSGQGYGVNSDTKIGPDSQITFETFTPEAYFRRSVTIPATGVSDLLREHPQSERSVLWQRANR